MCAMGHRSPTMTTGYSEFTDSERRWAFVRPIARRGSASRVCSHTNRGADQLGRARGR
jgi:hypothetical protein